MDFLKRTTIKFSILILISISLYSCGKESKNESQNSKTGSQTTETEKSETSKKETGLSSDFIISYDLEGKLKGKMEIFRSGEKLKQYMNTEIMGVKNTNTVYIIDNNVYSVIDLEGTKIGNKTDLANFNKQKKTGETITDFKEFEKFLEDKKITGTENILGHNCDIYDISGGVRLSIYDKRYILKINSPEFTAVATALNTSPSFAKNEFELPADVDFNSIDMKGLNKKNLDSLVKKYKQ
ncbi:MAG: hypothetical protein IPL53_12795 [Ignavibacteria bacterium]|nr:hypothetical protein [Ignavibacteria bacterium]